MPYVYMDCPDCGNRLVDVNTLRVVQKVFPSGDIYKEPVQLMDFWQYCENPACGFTSEFSAE